MLILILNSCKQNSNKQLQSAKKSSDNKNQTINEDKHYIKVEYPNHNNISITKAEYINLLKNELKEITSKYYLSPDTLYHLNAFKSLSFSSEQGQDLFCQIYARYLSENKNKAIPTKIKNELEEIFYSINNFINENENLGAGYYHIFNRTPAYVEYELLSYDKEQNENKPNIKEKEEFVRQLKKQIVNKNSNIIQIALDDLNKLIDTDYKLKRAKSYLERRYGYLIKL